jgi:PAS domain-containing protein
MVVREHHHATLIKNMARQLKPVLDKSPQGIYIYMDDEHKTCNRKFADMFGYGSVQEWEDTEAPLSDVVEEDQDAVIEAYQKASENMAASCVDVRVKNVKTGKIIKTTMIVAPITDTSTHVFTVHFISRK